MLDRAIHTLEHSESEQQEERAARQRKREEGADRLVQELRSQGLPRNRIHDRLLARALTENETTNALDR